MSTPTMDTSSKVLSHPLPSPKVSPIFYPDLYGKRREIARIQMLEREISFLEEELKSSEGLQAASKCCKEIADFVMENQDPLLPTSKKKRRSRRFRKWLCRMSCFNLSWICCWCCYCCTGNCCHCKPSNCNCSCLPSIKCSLTKHCCCSDRKQHCCKNICGCNKCCILPSCNFGWPCPSCCCCKCSCSCSCPRFPRILLPCGCCTKC